MKARLAFATGALALLSLVSAAEKMQSEPEIPSRKPLSGNYQIYGGTLSEMLPPAPKTRR